MVLVMKSMQMQLLILLLQLLDGFVIAIFSRKCIPWISARCAVETKRNLENDKFNADDEYETYGTEMGTHV